jgi:serine/threonine-protein kinase
VTDGIDQPAFCAIDSQGNLWLANNGGAPNVTEYLKGSTRPHLRIIKGLTYPIGIALDRAGNVYVGNHVPYGTTNIQVYPPGKKSPTRTITDGVVWPTGIAVDGNGTLYVANDSAPCNVEEYHSGQSQPYAVITNDINGPTGVSVGKNGWLYVSNQGRQGCSGPWPVVLEFRPHTTKPSRKTISKELHTPVGNAYYPPLLP